MRPALKRTIVTSKTTGRRYYLGKTGNRSNGRRYYVCSKADCEGRLARESDLFCRAHSQLKKSDDVNEDNLNDTNETIDDDKEGENTTEINDSIPEDNLNKTLPLSAKQKAKINREVHIDEISGARTFRDESGRRRYLCTKTGCTNMLKRQSDLFCRRHTVNDNEKKKTRHSEPPLSDEVKNRFRSPFSTPPPPVIENGTNGNHSEEYESPEKTTNPSGTNRTFRDASGKLRFLCFNPSCNSRLIRRSDTYCKRHQLDNDNNVQLITTNDSINHDKEENNIEEMDVNHNNPDIPSRQISSESSIKKRKHESEIKISNLSIIPENKMVISTTTLLDDQWNDVLIFLHQFPQVKLSTNLNVNNLTTHLIVDDSEKYLHCTITKKIVQAAVRRHIFIISTCWINKCINSNQFIDEHPYEIQSDSHTTLRLSIQNNEYLFNKTYGFAIECRQCQGSINRNELIELIHLTGGILYENDINSIDILIILCDINEKNLNKIKEKYLDINIKNIKYVTSDFLLKSIIKFQIQDIDKYSL